MQGCSTIKAEHRHYKPEKKTSLTASESFRQPLTADINHSAKRSEFPQSQSLRSQQRTSQVSLSVKERKQHHVEPERLSLISTADLWFYFHWQSYKLLCVCVCVFVCVSHQFIKQVCFIASFITVIHWWGITQRKGWQEITVEPMFGLKDNSSLLLLSTILVVLFIISVCHNYTVLFCSISEIWERGNVT